jgi:glycine cleavage system aminomethyltransferase T
MSVGTAFHERTAPLNRKLQWREWAGYWAAGAYADHHDIEYNAIRSAAALIDVSPLYKYRISGPDAQRFVDRVMIRDAAKLREGRVKGWDTLSPRPGTVAVPAPVVDFSVGPRDLPPRGPCNPWG